MTGVGGSEILVVLLMLIGWAIPVAVAVWAMVTLYRIRADQEVIRAKLEAIERTLARGGRS
jgi:hypothetical protein